MFGMRKLKGNDDEWSVWVRSRPKRNYQISFKRNISTLISSIPSMTEKKRKETINFFADCFLKTLENSYGERNLDTSEIHTLLCSRDIFSDMLEKKERAKGFLIQSF